MTLTHQITPFTCGLACIESIAHDLGKPITQCEILKKYKKELIAGCGRIEQFGAVPDHVLEDILQREGFATSPHKDHRKDLVKKLFDNLTQKQAVLITALFAGHAWHSVRWAGNKNDNTFFVMDPNFGNPQPVISEYDIDLFIQWDFSFIVVTAP